MKKVAVLVGILAVVFLCSSVFAADANAVLGKWWNEAKTSNIEIYNCGGKLCGKIVFLKEPVYPANDAKGMAGKPKVDRENPDAAKRSTPILGMNILQGFTFAGDNVWEGGTIYNPEDGKTYKCKLTLEKPDLLKVRGYVGTPLLGKTQMWTRVK